MSVLVCKAKVRYYSVVIYQTVLWCFCLSKIMVFSANDRILIKQLQQLKGWGGGAKKLATELPTKRCTVSGAQHLLTKITRLKNLAVEGHELQGLTKMSKNLSPARKTSLVLFVPPITFLVKQSPFCVSSQNNPQ